MYDISDPTRVGRTDRRRARKLIDGAYAAGRLTATDRAFRAERLAAAYTKGDLAVLVRDLDGGAPPAMEAGEPTQADPSVQVTPSLGSAIPPDQLASMSVGGGTTATPVNASLQEVMTGGGAATARRVIVVVAVGVALLFGLGVVSVMTVIVREVSRSVDPIVSTPAVALNLQTAKGWASLVEALGAETGSARVYDAVVYPEYASITTVTDEGAVRRVFRNGGFLEYDFPPAPALGRAVNLAKLDPEVVARLPARTAKHENVREYETAYLVINALFGGPRVTVYLTQASGTFSWTVFDFAGKVIGGTPKVL